MLKLRCEYIQHTLYTWLFSEMQINLYFRIYSKGEKLPWSLKLKNGCIMTVGGTDTSTPPLNIVHPCNVAATLAITCTYEPPASQNIAALSACVHFDSELVRVSLSRPQVRKLFYFLRNRLQSILFKIISYGWNQ